jgi:eukaryotic-like serine/threonine-protein kinase
MNELTKIGRYQIETLLGSGAYADVYRATDSVLRRTVALKVLKPALLADQEAYARFVQEAQIGAGLVHPRVAWVWDLGEADGRYFIAMRYVDGPSLDRVIREQGALGWEDACRIFNQVVEALAFSHGRGLVHRDVKPQNILISAAEGAVLTDFGLVRAMEASGSHTRTGALLGTPQYMAPEIWKGETAGPAADQYALGCVLAEMLTGACPFEAPTPPAVMMKHILEPAQFPARWPDGAPQSLSAALQKALAKTPAERFDSVQAFAEALMKKPAEAVSAPAVAAPQPAQASQPAGKPAPAPKLVNTTAKPLSAETFTANQVNAKQVTAKQVRALTFNAEPPPTKPPSQASPADPANQPRPEYHFTPEDEAAATALIASLPWLQGRVEVKSSGLLVTVGPDIDILFARIPAGEFWMGSDLTTHMDANLDEGPLHKVWVDEFWMARIPVTCGQYAKFVEATWHPMPTGWKKGGLFGGVKVEYVKEEPVVNVSWNDAAEFCDWAHVRLPTEAEWEKAARGSDQRIWPWGNEKCLPGQALPPCNVKDAYRKRPGPSKSWWMSSDSDSPYGIKDMAGNVWEWCQDWYQSDWYSHSPARNPTGPAGGEKRVLRGGSWFEKLTSARCASRCGEEPSWKDNFIGVRVVLSAPAK